MKTCCLTGHRPKGFPWDYADKDCMEHKSYLALLREKVVELISKGYSHFISGGALGADSDFAEIVIDLRKSAYPDITFEIAVPCPNQDLKWRSEDKRRYKKIFKAADSVNVISEKYSDFCMQNGTSTWSIIPTLLSLCGTARNRVVRIVHSNIHKERKSLLWL